MITGRQAIDGDTAQVGPQIAEHLDLPQVSYLEDLKFDGEKTFTMKRHIEEGYQILEVEAPCVVTVLASANNPRYMSVGGIVDAYQKEVEVWGKDQIEVDETLLGLKGSPTSVHKAFARGLKPAGELYEVDTDEAVGIIINKMKEKFIL